MNRHKNDVGKVTLKFVEEAFELMNPDIQTSWICVFASFPIPCSRFKILENDLSFADSFKFKTVIFNISNQKKKNLKKR